MKRADEMRAVFARFEESGLTLKAFGEREGISYTTLQYWRRKLRDASSPSRDTKKSEPVAFAPVRVIPDAAPAPRSSYEVWLSNGVSLEVPPGFDGEDLRRLVDVLATC